MDAASSQPGDLALSLPQTQESARLSEVKSELAGVAPALAQELWLAAAGEECGIQKDEFTAALGAVAARFNYGLPSSADPDAAQKAAFYRGLRLPELALAHGCAQGRDAAWERFVKLYRGALTQAAIAIAGSATLGHELADSLYAELYGLKVANGERRSPLASYSGRGSLLGWLRTTLAQRHIDHHRRTRREAPLDGIDAPAAAASASPAGSELKRLASAVARALETLTPEDRFLLAAYFLDRQTLLQIGRVLRVHEATISRRLKRLTADLRKLLLDDLQSRGLSKRAAEEALGTDPRDIELEINLRSLLQTSQTASFLDKTEPGKREPDTATFIDHV